MLDKRIKTAGQVEKMLGYKPLAALLDSEQNGVSPRAIADRIRRLALALDRAHKQSGKPSNLILITSVNPQSAVTSLVLDLVRDYDEIGVRAVAVEVNLLKPDKRYVSSNTGYGFINLLLDPNLDVVKAVSPANDKYPDRISIGITSEELFFEYRRLQMVLEKIAEIYSVVILDASPILFSADVEFLTSISDITLLVIAAQQAKPGEIKRAVKLLERIDPETIGFVVTRLEVFKGGGYYSTVNKVDSKPNQAKTNLFARYFKKNDNKQE
jgi:Mrp family chromosome partitioning ATPase